MTKQRKGIKKRYLITISSILLAVLSVLLLRTFDMDFHERKIVAEKELNAVLEFNKDFFIKNMKTLTTDEKSKLLRDKFANTFSYKRLFDERSDFKNFKYLPDKKIYGFQTISNAHAGFYYNNDDCGNINENKDYCAGILVDINGYTRPNRFGKDQFLFKIYKNGLSEN